MSYALKKSPTPMVAPTERRLSECGASAPVLALVSERQGETYQPIAPAALLAEHAKLWAAQCLLKACLQLETLPTKHALLAYVCFSLPSQPATLLGDKSLKQNVHSDNDSLGALLHWRYEAVEALLETLLLEGYLAEQAIDKEAKPPVISPTAKGFALAKGFYLVQEPEAVSLQAQKEKTLVPALEPPDKTSKPERKKQHTQLKPPVCFEDPSEQALYDGLRAYRWQLAQAGQLRAYRVCSNAVLEAMVREKPRTLAALQALHGVGEKFSAQYGEGFIKQLQAKRV